MTEDAARRIRMTLPAGEPPAGPWRVAPVEELFRLVRDVGGPVVGRPLVLAVDGRGAGGKTTLGRLLADGVPDCVVVHTDDIAWHHSIFGWAELILDGVLGPARSGKPVRYRPPAWDERDRAGAVEVPEGTKLLVVEGVGAGRRELSAMLDAVVWVQSDFAEAERRGIARDVTEGVHGDRAQITGFWHEWMAEELPFLAADRPWERACAIVAGTPDPAPPPGHVVLAPPIA